MAHLLAKRWHTRWKLRLPAMLVSFRAALGPGIIVIGQRWRNGTPLTVCIVMALVSDLADGVLARRWRIDTENLRRWDTRADTFFYACVFLVVLLLCPGALARRGLLIAGLITAEILHHVFAAAKYGRHASYHSILSKIWGLLMAAAMIALLGFGVDNWFLDFVLAWGVLCNLQGLAMSLLLPTWQRDVPTLFHAWKLRNNVRTAATRRQRPGPLRAWW